MSPEYNIMSLKYYLHEGIKSSWRNRLATLLAFGIIAISFYILGVFLLLSHNLSRVVTNLSDNAILSVFLTREFSEDRIDGIRSRLDASFLVKSCVFISPKKAESEFMTHFPGFVPADIKFKESPFPASFEVRLQDRYIGSDEIQKLIAEIQQLEDVEEVQYDQVWVENLTGIIKIIKILILFLGITLIAASISTISNVIRLAIYYRKDEIEVMRLVGAELNFIKGPFVMEGMIQGALGAVTALALLLASHRIFLYYIQHVQSFILKGLYPEFFSFFYIIAYILGGLMLGMVGSISSLRKYVIH